MSEEIRLKDKPDFKKLSTRAQYLVGAYKGKRCDEALDTLNSEEFSHEMKEHWDNADFEESNASAEAKKYIRDLMGSGRQTVE
jgi:hypothetical protein